MYFTTKANGFFSNTNTKYVNLDVIENSPNRIGDVVEINKITIDGEEKKCVTIQYRDLRECVILCEKPFNKLGTYTEFHSPSEMFDGELKDYHIILEAEIGENYPSKIQLHLLCSVSGVDKHTATYSGLSVKSHFDSSRPWFWNFPEIMDEMPNYCKGKDLEKLGFSYREPTATELLIYDGKFWRGSNEISWNQIK